MAEEREVFTSEDVISTYTDKEAREDGSLVAVNTRDRVTRAVWEWLVEKQPKTARPPNCWPVAMMTWFQAAKIQQRRNAEADNQTWQGRGPEAV